jgi:flagellar biosynthetic protein FliP
MTRQFVRHYVEMVVVMFVGMALLWAPADLLVNTRPTGAMLGTMAFTMTAPMIPWMRWRGHDWAPTLEMAASMIVPSLAMLALLGAHVVTDTGVLLGVEHVAMLGGMFVAMVARRDEYSHHHHGVSA